MLRQGGRGRSTLTLVEFEGRRALLKNFAHEGALFRKSLGRIMAIREARAYRRLARVEGVPQLLGRLLPDGLVIEYFGDSTLARNAGNRLSPDFFERLSTLLRCVRARGVLHGDIGHNVLHSDNGRPLLVDFGASFVIPPMPPRLRAAILDYVEFHDERAIVKLKARSAPNLMTDTDQQVLASRLSFDRPLELLEKMVRSIVMFLTGPTVPRG